MTVDGFQSPRPLQPDEHHWRLPSTDPRDEGKFLFRIHTIDLYFWTADDAQVFIDSARKTLLQEQLQLTMPPAPEPHAQLMSPVVQQLENVAITDPAYHNGQTRNSRTASIPIASPIPGSVPLGATLPAQATHGIPPQVIHDEMKDRDPQVYKPLSYNPAAPPAPEVIKHREKTPPPPDAVAGTGLAVAAYHDHVQDLPPQPHGSIPVHSPGYQPAQTYPTTPQSHVSSGYTSPPASGVYTTSPPPSAAYTASPPLSAAYTASPPPSGNYATSPATSITAHRTSNVSITFPPPPQQKAVSPVNPYIPQPDRSHSAVSHPPGSGPIPSVNQPHTRPPQDPNAHLYGQGPPPLMSPTVQILGDSYIAPPPQPLQHLQPQYPDYLASHTPPQQPPGGYSDYNYDQSTSGHHHHHHNNGHSIHSQVYRPTEAETQGHSGRKPSTAGPGQQPGRLEQGAERVEKGVNRFLRKLEKRMG